MDPAKIAFLFGTVPDWVDPDDQDDRATLIADQLLDFDDGESEGILMQVFLETIASQIADDNPPEVWATAQRLLAMGLDRDPVMANLLFALVPSIKAAVTEKRPFDPAAYTAILDLLPVPKRVEILQTMLETTRSRQPIPVDELEALTAAGLGLDLDEPVIQELMDEVSDKEISPDGPLALLAGDLVVEPASLCAGLVLTHRLTESERALGMLPLNVDLVGFARAEAATLASTGEPLETFFADDGDAGWDGPPGWLDDFRAGDLLAMRMADEAVTIDVLDQPPPVDDALVEALLAVYHGEADAPQLPVSAEDLLLGLVAGDRERFSTPEAPLGDLIAAAGLELRDGYAAHDPQLWANTERIARIARVMDLIDSRKDAEGALELLDCFEDDSAGRDRLVATAWVLADPDLVQVVIDEMLGDYDDADRVAQTADFASRVLAAVKDPTEIAAARWLAAIASERAGDVLVAEAQLHLAVEADSDWGPAVDRLAWYLSDRGQAAEAARLWRGIGFTAKDSEDLATVEKFTRTGKAKIGRNEPCWCGSGRKYKVCHLGAVVTASLPDRVGWLWRKAAGFLGRRGGSAAARVLSLAAIRATSGAGLDHLERALSDSMVIDLALTEGGWFGRFLDERGALLPEDEAMLATSWLLVDRGLYEVIAVKEGSGLTLEDLRSAERIEVREGAISQQVSIGAVICARAVPDGHSHQLIGGIFPVRPGREAEVLDLLDEGEPEALAAYVGSLDAPPTILTRENEPVVTCTAEVVVADPEEARAVLDASYERQAPGTWVEMHQIDPADDEDRILRATLHLDGDRLSVDTASEPRMDRVLALLRSEIRGAKVVSDERLPLRPGKMPAPPRHLSGPALDPDVAEAMSAEFQDVIERRWCDDPVPALAGLTPRQAANDPSRREALERLLREFESFDPHLNAGAITMRPARLRELLDL